MRFVRIAARYEEEYLGSTSIGYPSSSFEFTNPSEPGGRLGSGLPFVDDILGAREMLANASRIEGWRHTRSYEYYKAVSKPVSLMNGACPSEISTPQDFKHDLENNSIQGFDLAHQLWRMRHGKNMPDAEVELIMRTLVDSVQTYEQIVEVITLLPCPCSCLC